MSHSIRLKVFGELACFTRPEMKVERVSYDIMTPSAARGILEAIHWKPAIRWVVDEIFVLKPIRHTSIRRNEVSKTATKQAIRAAMSSGNLSGLEIDIEETRQQRAALVLADVAYVIKAHPELTEKAGESDNPTKHYEMFRRRAQNGQCFQQPCFGAREFGASFELVSDNEVLNPIPLSKDFGYMLWDIDYSKSDKRALFFRAEMNQGVITVPQPWSMQVFA